MRRALKKTFESQDVLEDLPSGATTVENFKRRRALSFPSASVMERDLLFFDRIFQVRKFKDLVFVTKAEARLR